MKRQAIGRGGGGEIGVVGNYGDELAGKFTGTPPQDQIVKAVIEFRDENSYARALGGGGDAGVHAERGGEVVKCGGVGRGRALGWNPLDALKEDARLHVAVLVRVEDVSTPLEDPAGDPSHEAGLIGTVEQGDEGRGRGHGTLDEVDVAPVQLDRLYADGLVAEGADAFDGGEGAGDRRH